MAFKPVGAGASIAIAANAAVGYSNNFAHQGEYLRVATENASCYVAAGSTAVAASTEFFIGKDKEATINIGKPASQRVVGLTTGATTVTIDFPEGTGCPFYVGQNVSLSSVGANKHWEFTHKPVESINNTAGINGYFSTRIVVSYGYQDWAGIMTAFTGDNSYDVGTELRDSILVSVKGTAAQPYGAAYYQQVQVSGDA